MFFNRRHNFCFIHMPRTGGTSVTEALAERLHGPATVVDVYAHKHATAAEIRSKWFSGDAWDRLFKVTIVRNPWDMIRSDYVHTMLAAERIHSRTALECCPGWMQRMRRTQRYGSFARFVEGEYLDKKARLQNGGFWPTYCCDEHGEEMDVGAIRYDELKHAFYILCRDVLQMARVPRLPRVNQTRASELIRYTPELRDAVGEKCLRDVGKFGWEPPA